MKEDINGMAGDEIRKNAGDDGEDSSSFDGYVQS